MNSFSGSKLYLVHFGFNLVHSIKQTLSHNDITISITTMTLKAAAASGSDGDDDVRAIHTSLSGASYYDINLSLAAGEFNRRLVLINLTSPSSTWDASYDSMFERKLWPALVFASFKDLCSQLEDDGRSPVEQKAGPFMSSRFILSAHQAVRKSSELNITNAGFAHLLGIENGESSIVAFKAGFAQFGGVEMGNSSIVRFKEEDCFNTQRLIFDFEPYHEIEMGRALMNTDDQLIAAFQIAWARRHGVLASLKENCLTFQFDVTLCGQELMTDKVLFQQPEATELGDCPICMIPLPTNNEDEVIMYNCCSKIVCGGCNYAHQVGTPLSLRSCPFCREQLPETVEGCYQLRMKRVEMNDPMAL